MLHKVSSIIVNGKHWLSESTRKFCPFNSTCERRPGNLVQSLAHGIVSQAFARWALAPMLMVVILVARERLTGWSSRSGSIAGIPLITRRNIRVGGSLPSPFMAQLPLQMINLQLHGSGVFLMRDMTPTSRMASTSMGGMHTSLLVPSALKIEEMILTLGPHRFLSIWT